MKKQVQQLLTSLMLIAYSNAALAESGVIRKLQDTLQEWIGGMCMVGLCAGVLVMVLGWVVKMKFFEYYADEYKKTLTILVLFTSLAVVFQAEIAQFLTVVINPLGIR